MKSAVARLSGMELSGISVGANLIRLELIKYPLLENLRATDEGSIEIETGYAIECDGQFDAYDQTGNFPHLHAGVPHLLKLISHTIISAAFVENNELQLIFDNQTKLICRKNATGFESFHINLVGDVGGVTV